jgi:Potential Queuosine, Q, salvage protein family
MDDLRSACTLVASRATRVTIDEDAIAAYAIDVRRSGVAEQPSADAPLEERAAAVLTLDAINFGSGWFPTLRKREGLSGYNTIAAAWREQPLPTSGELAEIDHATVARTLGQDPGHELMGLYAASLRDLGAHVAAEHDGSFAALATSTPSAVALAHRLGSWPCFADTSRYGELTIPFLKRAQIAAADLARAGVTHPRDLGHLTMFADNLVPHVLRLDGVLHFDADLVARIDNGVLIEHGSPEEVEIRACGLHAVELIVAAQAATAPVTAAQVDECLWNRGQLPRYKAVPRHRSRCTAY